MNISYYTIDDLRLPPKRSLRKGRSVEQYSTLEEALARYQSMPAAGIRVLGLTDGIHVLELVKCLPLFPDDQEGEDVLALDYSCFPLWAQEPEAASATGACITAMGLRYRIKGNVIEPIPSPDGLPQELRGEIFMAESVRRGPVRHSTGLRGRNRLGIPRYSEPQDRADAPGAEISSRWDQRAGRLPLPGGRTLGV